MADAYVYTSYPKHLYHPDGRLAEVSTPAEEEEMVAQGFVDTPAKYGVETAPAGSIISAGGYVARGYEAPPSYKAPVAKQDVPPEALADMAALEKEAEAAEKSGRHKK